MAPPRPAWRRIAIIAALLAAFTVGSFTVGSQLMAGPAGAQPSDPAWDWPVGSNPHVQRAFDLPPEPWLSGHRGVDLAADGRESVVRAPADGRVSFAGWVVDRPVLTIVHRSGLRSSFESVQSDLSKGDTVSQGQVIGHLSNPPHCGASACLHWGVRRGEAYLNPLQFVTDLRPSVLLPLP